MKKMKKALIAAFALIVVCGISAPVIAANLQKTSTRVEQEVTTRNAGLSNAIVKTSAATPQESADTVPAAEEDILVDIQDTDLVDDAAEAPAEEPAPTEEPAPAEDSAPAEESAPAEDPAPTEEPAAAMVTAVAAVTAAGIIITDSISVRICIIITDSISVRICIIPAMAASIVAAVIANSVSISIHIIAACSAMGAMVANSVSIGIYIIWAACRSCCIRYFCISNICRCRFFRRSWIFEMESVIIIPAAVTAATAVTMAADIMEVITGRKYKGDILCAANRRSSRQ